MIFKAIEFAGKSVKDILAYLTAKMSAEELGIFNAMGECFIGGGAVANFLLGIEVLNDIDIFVRAPDEAKTRLERRMPADMMDTPVKTLGWGQYHEDAICVLEPLVTYTVGRTTRQGILNITEINQPHGHWWTRTQELGRAVMSNFDLDVCQAGLVKAEGKYTLIFSEAFYKAYTRKTIGMVWPSTPVHTLIRMEKKAKEFGWAKEEHGKLLQFVFNNSSGMVKVGEKYGALAKNHPELVVTADPKWGYQVTWPGMERVSKPRPTWDKEDEMVMNQCRTWDTVIACRMWYMAIFRNNPDIMDKLMTLDFFDMKHSDKYSEYFLERAANQVRCGIIEPTEFTLDTWEAWSETSERHWFMAPLNTPDTPVFKERTRATEQLALMRYEMSLARKYADLAKVAKIY